MKALFSAAAIAAATAMPATAGIVSLGNSLARDCYQAAVARDFDRNAMNHCNLALSQEGLDARGRAATLVNRGVLHMRGRSYIAANRDFDRALATDQSNAEAWLNKAIAKLQQNQGSPEALPLIERALALGTTEKALAYYSRAVVHERIGNVKAAYADLQRARALAPDWDAPAEDLKRYYVVKR